MRAAFVRRCEHQLAHVSPDALLQYVERSPHVDLEIFAHTSHGFGHRAKAGKVNDGVGPPIKRAAHRLLVAHIAFDYFNVEAGEISETAAR